MLDIRPVGSRVLLRVSPLPTHSKGGVLLPGKSNGRQNKGVVLRAAQGTEEGLEEGDEVVFDPYALDAVYTGGDYRNGSPATPVGYPGDTVLVDESAIIAVIT